MTTRRNFLKGGTAAATGIAQFYECGPGGALAGMMKRTAPEAPIASLHEFADIPA